MNAVDGTAKTKITVNPGDNTDASFSPDCQKIVFSSSNGELEFANIYTMDINNNTLNRITHYSNGYDGAPAWSPDGSKIAFESCPGDPDNSSGTTIWIIDVP